MSLNEWTDEQLKEYLAIETKELENHNWEIKAAQQNIQRYQTELDSRRLAAFWHEHPELTPVAVGDKLLVTEEFIEDRFGHGGMTPWEFADTIEVDAIYPNKEDGIQIALQGFKNGHSCVTVGHVPVEIVLGMRKAYLAQQQETST